MTDRVRRPAPINQFYQLDRVTPTSPWTKTSIRWNDVENGHNYDSENCMVAGGIVALDAHTGGRLHLTPTQLRSHQTDMSGGIGVTDVADAWAHYGYRLLTPGDYSAVDTMNALKARRGVLIGVDYRAVPYTYQIQKGGQFDHALYLNDIRSDGWLLRYDSLGVEPAWVPPSAVWPAAERLSVRTIGTSQRLFVGLTASRPLLGTAASHYSAHVDKRTPLYMSDGHTAYVQKVGTTVIVRGAVYMIAGKACYPVVAKPGYYLPKANVTLGAQLP